MSTAIKKSISLFCCLCLVVVLNGCFWGFEESHKEKADRLRKSENYQSAIDSYYQHIQDRLAYEKRPDWENPYIYLLDIGDIYLEQGDFKKALEIYEQAEKEGVKQAYCNDRYRAVALWHEQRGELKESLEILRHYREKDPFLMDLMLDRLARQLVAQEDSNSTSK